MYININNLCLSFFFHFEFFAQYGGYFTLHESPRHVRIGQWTFIAAWTVDLWKKKKIKLKRVKKYA